MKHGARFLNPVIFLFLAFNISHSQWVQTSGPTGSSVTALSVIGNRIFAGTKAGSVFQSTDDGSSWSFAATSLTSLGVRSLAAIDTMLFAGTGGVGVFRTVNYGAAWTPFNSGLTDMEVNALASNGATLFAGTRTGGVFRWMGSGNWGFVFPVSDVRAITALGNEVFAGAYGFGVFRSADNGTSWAVVNNGLGSLSVQTVATDGAVVLVGTGNGIFRSTNHGAAWTSTNVTSSTVALLFAGGLLFAGTSSGTIYRSSDAGIMWTSVFTIGLEVNALVTHGTNVFAGIAENGVFRSTNLGAQWHSANTGFANTSIFRIAALDTAVVCISSQSKVFRSSDNGTTWHDRTSAIPDPFAASIAALGNSFFIGTSFDLYGGIYRSTNDGTSWARVLSAGGVYSLGGRGQNVFAGTLSFESYRVYRSTNGGSVWNLPGASLFARAFTVFDSVLFAGNYRSTDNGTTWTAIPLPAPVIAYIVHDSMVFAGTQGSGAFRSSDRGSTWINIGFQSNAVAGFVSFGRSLFAAALGGVHRTTNNGATWTPVNEGLPPVTCIAANATQLFAGTSVSGVWRRPLSQIVVNVPPKAVPTYPRAYRLDQNYPNPFNPATTIHFSVGTYGHTSLRVFDVLGREVSTLVNEVRTPGEYEVEFNPDQLSSAVYYYRLNSAGFSQTRKMILVR